jgi:tetratricopeptide (TPR) repeat protein
MNKLMYLISAMFLLTLTVFSQEPLTSRQINLHRRYDNYYTFEVSSDRKPLSYKQWLIMKKIVDTSGVDYIGKYGAQYYANDTNLYKAILKNDSINTPKEGHQFFNKAVEYFKEKRYPDALRYFTYAINTNGNFAFAYFDRAITKAQLKLHYEELIPDLTMACNLGIPDACTALRKIRNNQEFIQLLFFSTW